MVPYKNWLKMKPCHICEKIVRTEKSITCSACKKIYCFMCIAKHFPEKAAPLLTRREHEAFPSLKTPRCFACLKECYCHKCRAQENVVIAPAPPPSTSNPYHFVKSLVNDEELIPEAGFFRGRKVGELPLHLQRIYLKKKVLYSKHEISCLSNDKNIPEQQNAEQPEEKAGGMAEEKERKEEESPLQNNQDQEEVKGEDAPEKDGKNEMDEEDEQADDFESEFSSRRGAHLHNQAENSAPNDADVEDQPEVEPEDPDRENYPPRGDSMNDENGENQPEMLEEGAEEAPLDPENAGSVEQPAQ